MTNLSLMMLQKVLITKAKMCQCLYSPVLCSGSLGRAVPEQAGLPVVDWWKMLGS